MKKSVKFESICATYSCKKQHEFSLFGESIGRMYDYVEYHSIKFLGIPDNLDDSECEQIDDGDYTGLDEIAELRGRLILCQQMLEDGEEPYEICDNLDGDLEYTISALSDPEGPLNSEEGDPYQNVYYIDQLNIKSDYESINLKKRIIQEIPEMIFKFCHIEPSIIAYYPASLEHEPDQENQARRDAVQNILAQKVEAQSRAALNSNIINFGANYPFSEEEVNMILGRRNPGISYPESAKDLDEFVFYELVGFSEIGNSRLLYKKVF